MGAAGGRALLPASVGAVWRAQGRRHPTHHICMAARLAPKPWTVPARARWSSPPAPPPRLHPPIHPPTPPSVNGRPALSRTCPWRARSRLLLLASLLSSCRWMWRGWREPWRPCTAWPRRSLGGLQPPSLTSFCLVFPPCPGSSSLSPFSVSVSPPVFSAPALASCSHGLPASPPNAVHSCCGARLCPGIHLSLAGYAPPGWAGRPAAQRQLRLATSGHAQPRTQHASTLSLPPLLRCAGCCAWSAAVRPS